MKFVSNVRSFTCGILDPGLEFIKKVTLNSRQSNYSINEYTKRIEKNDGKTMMIGTKS